MQRILIAGCGYVGEATADLFHNGGWHVEGWTFSRESADALGHKPYRVTACDISDAAAVRAHAGEQFGVVLQCVSSGGGDADAYRHVYLRGAQNLLGAFRDATPMFTSSTSVYAQRDGEWVTEDSAAEPTRETARVLRQAEQLVLARNGIVARLGGIYGPGRSFMLKNLVSADAAMPAQDRFVNQVHRDDAAAALFLLASRGTAGIWNVVDDQPTSLHRCYEWLAARLNRRMPAAVESSGARKRGESNKRVSNAKLRALGWEPRYPRFEIGMAESVIPSWKS